jgi:hypothetical protein
MNERIKELSVIAKNLTTDDAIHLSRIHNRTLSLDELEEIFAEKFAELLIKECVDIACNYDKPKLSGPGLAIACNIESHFDVYTEEDGRFVK